MSLSLDKFADTICDISGAASKELSIEQVLSFCHSQGALFCLIQPIYSNHYFTQELQVKTYSTARS